MPADAYPAPGGAVDYDSYLRLRPLLGQQVPVADPPAHDELMFIVVHQAGELWFKLMLHELEAARDAMLAGRLDRARRVFGRVHAIQRLLLAQFDVLDTMDPQGFDAFRGSLGTASGMQSVQAREVEFLSGAKDRRALGARSPFDAEGRARLERRFAQPSLWDAFVALMSTATGRRGVPGDDDWLVRSLAHLASDRDAAPDVWAVARSLVEYDRLAGQWRFRHLQVVEWMIGHKRGTGGTAGVEYLRRRLGDRYFPLLWELPTGLGTDGVRRGG
jgi:tryptophan 2,3-dioxygenase